MAAAAPDNPSLLIHTLIIMAAMTGCYVQGVQVLPPVLSVTEEVILTKTTGVTEDLTITCMGQQALTWHTPHCHPPCCHPHQLDDVNVLNITNSDSTNETYPFTSILKVNTHNHGHTGQYSCIYKNTTENTRGMKASTYVYFHSSNKGVKLADDLFDAVDIAVGSTLILDCRPTHPNHTVSLEANWEDVDLSTNKRIKFDPKIGFTMKNVTMDDDGEYICDPHRKIIVNVKEAILPPPKAVISYSTNQHFVVGEDIVLTCKPDIWSFTYALTARWIPPVGKRIYNITSLEQDSNRAHSVLTIHNATVDDSGSFKCSIHGPCNIYDEPEITTMTVHIEDTWDPYVSLNSTQNIFEKQAFNGNFTWTTNLRYYPTETTNLSINYFGPNGNIETKFTDYDADTSVASLTLPSVSPDDFGNYSLQVITSDGSANQTTTIMLIVKSPLEVSLHQDKLVYNKGDMVYASCDVQGYPVSEISWRYLYCYESESFNCTEFFNMQRDISTVRNMSDVFAYNILEGDLTVISGNHVNSSVQFTADKPGQLQCLANNSNGDFKIYRTTINVTPAPINPGEVNHTAEAPLMIKSGKPLSLTCNLPNIAEDDATVEWIKDGDTEDILESDDKYTVFGNNHTLIIKSAQLGEDAGTYECSTTSKTPFTKQFFVYSPILIKSGEPLSLTCNLPNIAEDDATVEWIKDGDKECILESDDKYTVFGQNHTLLIKSALPDEDEGTYECSSTSKTPFTKQFFVYSWHMRHMPKSLVVYEAQDIKMTCEVKGRPNVTVQWHKDEQKLNDADSKYEYSANDDDIAKAILSIKDAQQLDRGNYTCQVFSIQGVYNTSTYVRVKSVYAPLYPAVGILVLFALLALTIIFFERRDANQEYQESDTDQDGAEIFRYKRHYDE